MLGSCHPRLLHYLCLRHMARNYTLCVGTLCMTADLKMSWTFTKTFSLMPAARLVAEQMPSSADVVFDCIRICWLSIIVSILFLDASLSTALWIGLVAGLAYTL